MALFKFTQQDVERYATEQARKRFEARERERAATKPTPGPAEPAPASAAPKPITLADAQSLGIPEGDPFLVSIEMREKLAAGPGTNQSPASAGQPGNEPKNPVHPAAHPAGQASPEQIRRAEDHIRQAFANLHIASHRDIVRAIHADRHPAAFREAWQSLRRAGDLVKADSTGRAVLWTLRSGK